MDVIARLANLPGALPGACAQAPGSAPGRFASLASVSKIIPPKRALFSHPVLYGKGGEEPFQPSSAIFLISVRG